MIRTIDLRGRVPSRAEVAAAIPRAEHDVAAAVPVATELVTAVRAQGETALRAQADRFDGGAPMTVRVAPADIAAAVAALEPTLRAALEVSIERRRATAAAQIPPAASTTVAPGAVIEQRWHPIGRVGLYIPGGKAVLPSSVVMNVVPAQVAGVRSIALASPPQRDHAHAVHPVILGVAGLLGIDEVYAMGGAGAIGAFAYGVPSIGLEPVDLVAGPGNAYVTAAKRVVLGTIGVDAEAGPSEVLVLADGSADARFVAADLMSQAEHGADSAAILVTWSPELATRVEAVLAERVPVAPATARIAGALAGPQSAIVLVDGPEAAAAVANAVATEHLEIQTSDPEAMLARIDDAGAIFIGPNSPVSAGDYATGSNHVLPTGGAARFQAGLSAATFLRAQQIIRYDEAALRALRPHVRVLSDAEGLPTHGDAVDIRFS